MTYTRQSGTLFIFILFALLASILAVINIGKDSNKVNLITSKLIFQDEFEGKILDGSRWNTCYDWNDTRFPGCTNHGNDELEWYIPRNVNVSNGNLILTAQKEQITGLDKNGAKTTYPYSSGLISTGRLTMGSPAKWVNSYGYYESRINAPPGKGVWPAFWLLPEGREWPPEIDIMEILGDRPNEVLATYFWKDVNGNQAKDSYVHVSQNITYTGSWHTYAVEWLPGKLTWYIDGQMIRSVKSSNVPSKPMEMILNLAVGGRLPGNPDAQTAFPVEMKIDYVRVYDSKPN